MKLKILTPFMLITIIWSAFSGMRNGENDVSIFGFVIGSLLGLVGIPLGIAMLTVKNSNIDYPKRRLKVFAIIWGLLIFAQVYVAFGQTPSNPNKDYSKSAPKVNGNSIFRSTENFYRIKIPNGWTINKGNSLGAEFNAMSESGEASLNIVVATMKDSPKFTSHDVPVNVLVNTLKEKNETVQLIESEKQYLSNEKALYIKYKMNYKTVDSDTDIICIQYSVIKKNRIFTITLQAQQGKYSKFQDTFTETLQSFTFEDY